VGVASLAACAASEVFRPVVTVQRYRDMSKYALEDYAQLKHVMAKLA